MAARQSSCKLYVTQYKTKMSRLSRLKTSLLSKVSHFFLTLISYFRVKIEKRNDRRKEINRPKRSINFALDNNKTKEFRITDIVQSDDRVIKSALRNNTVTPGRLVKIRVTDEEPAENNENNTNETNAAAVGGAQNQGSTQLNQPDNAGTQSPSDDNQSGEGSQGEERGSGEEEKMVLPTFEDINNNLDQQSQPQEQSNEEVKAAPAPTPTQELEPVVNQTTGTTPTTTIEDSGESSAATQAPVVVKKKFKEPQFEEESKVHEDPPSGDDAASESTNMTISGNKAEATGSTPLE